LFSEAKASPPRYYSIYELKKRGAGALAPVRLGAINWLSFESIGEM